MKSINLSRKYLDHTKRPILKFASINNKSISIKTIRTNKTIKTNKSISFKEELIDNINTEQNDKVKSKTVAEKLRNRINNK